MQTRKRTSIIIVLAFMLITVPLLGARADAMPERTVKIGFSGPLTGGAASWGFAVLNSYKYYAEKSNKAGGMKLGGEKVFFEVIGLDDKYVPSETVANVTKLIHVNKIDYLSVESGAGTMAVRDLTEENNIMTFSGGWADFLGPKYPRLFRNIFDQNASALTLSSYVKNNYPKVKSVVVINMDNDTGYACGKSSVKVWKGMGYEVLESVHYDVGTVDFFPLMTKLMAKKPDFIDFSGSTPPADIPLLAEAARDLGFTGDFTSGGMPDIPVKGVVTVGIVVGDPKETTAQKQYREDYMAEYGELHSWWEFYGSGTYPFFKNFLPDANSADPEAVYKTITAPGYKFDTWWGKSYWFGKDVWGIDRNLASWVPIKRGTGDKWVQMEYVPTEDYMPLYKYVTE